MRVAVLVPRRADHGRRDTLWAFVADWWAKNHRDFAVHEGHHEDGPFNRSAAINAAAAAAGDFDVAIVADADSFCGQQQITAAIDLAATTGRMTLAYDRFNYLSREMSDRVMAGFNGMWEVGVEWSLPGTCSSMVVTPRALWDAIGGFDEGFVGWGMEDVGASLAMQAIGGGLERIPGPVWHLHHTPSTENSHTSPQWQANVKRMRRYEACDYDAKKMRALLKRLQAGK
jgi:hypothetical protein